jgi:peroxygenase
MPSLKDPADEAVSVSRGHAVAEKPYDIAIPQVPVTEKRKPYVPAPGDPLVDPGTARANLAPSLESPNGTTKDDWAGRHKHQTVCLMAMFSDWPNFSIDWPCRQVIQQHVAFFDPDGDGVIWPIDTWCGFRKMGFSWPIAAFGTFIIHVALSYPTTDSLLPDPFFRIFTRYLHRDKHGSSSMTFDNEGRFRPQNFEDFFAKYDKDGKSGLSKKEIVTAVREQSFIFDFFGMSATALECKFPASCANSVSLTFPIRDCDIPPSLA